MKTIVHVNQHVIKANAKNDADDPVLTIKTYKENRYAHEAIIRDAQGNEVARVVYAGEALSCGARVWIETEHAVDLVVREPLETTTAA